MTSTLYGSATSFVDSVLPGIENEEAPIYGIVDQLTLGAMPQGFPRTQWNEQLERYSRYWYWWQGLAFEEIEGHTDTGEPVYKYPLKINTLRSYCRIHNAMLWGEIPDNKPDLVNTKITAQPKLTQDRPTDAQVKLARYCERVVEQVWRQSNARAILYEGGLLSQFLGGYYYQVVYQPWRRDLKIPFVIRPLKPDFVLPVSNPDNPWELLECFIIYRMTPKAASEHFGQDFGEGAFVTYVEHWTRETHSIYINGEPITAKYKVFGQEVTISYNKTPNRFGFVPIVYIPRLREGNFFGSAITPDVIGLMQEINSRAADAGDVMMQNSDRVWIGRNMDNPKAYNLPTGQKYINIGKENPAYKNPPELRADDPPNITQPMIDFTDKLRDIGDREALVSPIAYGIDEGSQRSGVTLQVRLYPTIAMARAQRGNWNTGLVQIDLMILRMMSILGLTIDGFKLPFEAITDLIIGHQWHPFIPREEEQEVNRLVLLKQAGIMSRKRAVTAQHDVDDVDEELKLLDEDTQAELELTIQGNSQDGAAGGGVKEPEVTTEVDDTE